MRRFLIFLEVVYFKYLNTSSGFSTGQVPGIRIAIYFCTEKPYIFGTDTTDKIWDWKCVRDSNRYIVLAPRLNMLQDLE